jgi:hypothetical protein
MKKKMLLMLLYLMVLGLFAYENSMLNLYAPTQLDKGQGQFQIKHRFYGDITEEPLDSFFGMLNGVNIGIDLRYQIFPKAEMTFNYSKFKKDTQFGLSYLLNKEDFPLHGQINIDYLTFKEPLMNDDRRGNFKSVLSIQNEVLWDRFVGTINTGYDLYYERPLLGFGANVMILDKVYLIGEYYPVLDRSTDIVQLKRYLKESDVFTVGLKLDTYGHHFKFQVSNSEHLTLHRLTMGADRKAPLMFGFNIERRLGL